MRQASNHSACPKGEAPRGENRARLYDEVTAKIIAQLEAGRFPWVQPWGSVGACGSGLAPALPHNALTGRAYSGVNVLLLWGSVIEFGYPSQGWLTFKQALEAGGHVRKGELGVGVVYADRFTPQAEKERAQQSGEDARSVPFLKRFTVFNVAQCEGLREDLFGDPAPLPEREIVPLRAYRHGLTWRWSFLSGLRGFRIPPPPRSGFGIPKRDRLPPPLNGRQLMAG